MVQSKGDGGTLALARRLRDERQAHCLATCRADFRPLTGSAKGFDMR